MPNQTPSEKILIFSAGANIHNTYSVTAEECRPTQVFVMAEEKVWKIAADKSDPKSADMQKIIDSINKLKKFVESENRRKFGVIKFPELTQSEIQNRVLELREKHPDAEFFFNVTAGTALFSTTLFLMGIWLGAKVCITRTSNDPPIYLTVPKISLADLERKPELKEILTKLGKEYPQEMSNRDLMIKLGYENVGTKYMRSSDKATHSKRMDKLIEYNLVEENRQGRIVSYRLTTDGEFAYKFMRSEKK